MNLWIRSQDKSKLRHNLNLEIDEVENKFYIVDRYDFEIASILGVYSTKERALEVLNEIEEKISLINTINLVKDRDSLISFGNAIPEEKISGLSYPYQMPKE